LYYVCQDTLQHPSSNNGDGKQGDGDGHGNQQMDMHLQGDIIKDLKSNNDENLAKQFVIVIL